VSEKKIKKLALSTLVLGGASGVTLLGGVLAVVFPSALWASFTLVVVGVGLTWVQKAVGDREHLQERKQDQRRAIFQTRYTMLDGDRIHLESNLYSRGAALPPGKQPKDKGEA
jgi:hypothetical protein